jgi:hypothetical protein
VPSPSVGLSRLIARRHGVVTKSELIGDGFTEHTIRRQVTAGTLVRMHSGVYRFATTAETFETRCAAACLADPSTAVTSISAGKLWAFRPTPRHDVPILVTGHDEPRLARGVIVRRSTTLPAEHVVQREDGIRLTTPPRAWFDCARDLDDDWFERLTEWVLDHHAPVPTLWGMRRTMTRRGRDGSARVNRVLSRRPTWQKPADSGLELKVLSALEARGIGPIVRQFAIRLPSGIVIHADGAIPPIRWAVEIDHVTWHGGRIDAQDDKARDRGLRRLGWQVDRVTDEDVRLRFRATIDELVELVELRRRAA